uniref:Uncharacterized protein n=1 Tax=Amphimedon queenslandica TaxID=400682 RepID=A0A1X7UU80_AMPQE
MMITMENEGEDNLECFYDDGEDFKDDDKEEGNPECYNDNRERRHHREMTNCDERSEWHTTCSHCDGLRIIDIDLELKCKEIELGECQIENEEVKETFINIERKSHFVIGYVH